MSVAEAVKHAEDCACRQCKRNRNEPETEKCDFCLKRRVCKQVQVYTDNLQPGKLATYDPHACLAQCFDLSPAERKKVNQEARAERKAKRQAHPPLAWPIIGGPLDGSFAVPADFYDDGRYASLARDYNEFNAGHGGNRRIGGFPTMIFVHVSKTPGMIRGRDR